MNKPALVSDKAASSDREKRIFAGYRLEALRLEFAALRSERIENLKLIREAADRAAPLIKKAKKRRLYLQERLAQLKQEIVVQRENSGKSGPSQG